MIILPISMEKLLLDQQCRLYVLMACASREQYDGSMLVQDKAIQ